MITPGGMGAAMGTAWIGSRSPAVAGAQLQRGWPVASVALQVFRPVQTCLQLGDHAAKLPSLELCDVQLLLGLGATAALLPIWILLIGASPSNCQILLLRYTIHRQ